MTCFAKTEQVSRLFPINLSKIQRHIEKVKAQLRLCKGPEIVVDNFAGGGGASTGIAMAIGRSPDIAINHDIDAIRMHEVNHPEPECKHYCESVWDVVPRDAANGRPVGLLWLSPDCKHFSKAKGSVPVSRKIRGLAWIALRWVGQVRPRVIMLENVEEFTTWGPLIADENGDLRPDPTKKGMTFRSFVNALQYQGYTVEWRELRAADYGTPTIRKRLFLMARCDGKPHVWPKPTNGKRDSQDVRAGLLAPWRSASEIIDWSIPCRSIFGRKKPLAEATMRRIALGLDRFIINTDSPFIVPAEHEEVYAPFITEFANASSQRNMPLDEPLRTICAQVKGGHFALVTPVITRQFGKSVGHSVNDPLGTITAGGGGKSSLVTAVMVKHYGGNYSGPGSCLDEPLHTVTTTDHNALVTSHLVKLRGTNIGSPLDEPLHTITAGGTHFGEVRAFLLKYYGPNIGHEMDSPLHTVTTRDRFGLVTVYGEQYQIVDIRMRMLKPHELFAAMGFPKDYVINRDSAGKILTQKAQVARCGNAVCPDIPNALVRANLPELCPSMSQRKAAA